MLVTWRVVPNYVLLSVFSCKRGWVMVVVGEDAIESAGFSSMQTNANTKIHHIWHWKLIPIHKRESPEKRHCPLPKVQKFLLLLQALQKRCHYTLPCNLTSTSADLFFNDNISAPFSYTTYCLQNITSFSIPFYTSFPCNFSKKFLTLPIFSIFQLK